MSPCNPAWARSAQGGLNVFVSLLVLLPWRVLGAPTVTMQQAVPAVPVDTRPLGGPWRHAAVISKLVQQQPSPGVTTPFKTHIKLLHTSKALYIAVAATDPHPAALAIHRLARDAYQGDDDHLTIVIDPLHGARNAYVFQVNAGGARRDGLISSAHHRPNWDWNGLWDARTWRTAQGWAALIKIPFASLRFNPNHSHWGFNVSRYVPRDQLTLTWAGHTLDSSVFDLHREGTLAGMAGLTTGFGLRIVPYGLIAASDHGARFSHKAGITVSDTLTPLLTGVLTIRPDFAESEAQNEQINLTPYPLFLPENRRFFLEGSNLFAFASGLGRNFIPFYSRQIGLNHGQAVPIDAGVKLVGEAGPVTLGLLGVKTATANELKSQNLFAGRMVYGLADGLNLGVILTHGDPSGTTTHATLYGADAVWRTASFRGNKNLQASAWGARSTGTPLTGGASGGGWRLAYPNDLWNAGIQYDVYGAALDPTLGFLPRPGTRQNKLWVGFNPRPQGGLLGWARQFFFQLHLLYNTDSNGRVENWHVFAAPFNVRINSGAHYEFDYIPSFQHLQTPFEIVSGVSIPAGNYPYHIYHFEAQSPPSRPWQIGGVVEVGSFYDGRLTRLNNFVRFSVPGGHWSFMLHSEQDFGYLPVGDFVTRLYALGMTWAANPNLSLASLWQYNTVSHRVALSNVLRWIIQPGSDLYVVFDHDLPTLTPNSPTGGRIFAGNVLTVKLAWTFEP